MTNLPLTPLDASFEPSYRILDAAVGFGPAADFPDTFVLAVSGGSDSMALLRVTHWLASIKGKRIVALTVDHGLRPESASEAERVAAWCADLGVEHHTLHWSHDGKGNLSAVAREGRYRLMAEFCLQHGYPKLYTGHTEDDQAETVLLRLARGSGVDGLSGMAIKTPLWGITIVRPFVFEERRGWLREVLHEFRQEWIDDPTNDDDSYDRVKARNALALLEPLGITPGRLSSTAYMQNLARNVLEERADVLRTEAVRAESTGYLTVLRAAFDSAHEETALRVIAGLLGQVSGRVHRPRLRATQLARFLVLNPDGTARTLQGCILRPSGDVLYILREPAACVDAARPNTKATLWDGRFRVSLADETREPEGMTIRALGETGLRQIPKDYDGYSEAWSAAPREARLTTPALWRGDVLVSAPLAPWSADPNGPTLTAATVWPASC